MVVNHNNNAEKVPFYTIQVEWTIKKKISLII